MHDAKDEQIVVDDVDEEKGESMHESFSDQLSQVFQQCGYLGYVTDINQQSGMAHLHFTYSDHGDGIDLWIPIAALEWPDQWVYREMQEIKFRYSLGVQGNLKEYMF